MLPYGVEVVLKGVDLIVEWYGLGSDIVGLPHLLLLFGRYLVLINNSGNGTSDVVLRLRSKSFGVSKLFRIFPVGCHSPRERYLNR